MDRQAFGTWYIGKRLCRSSCVFFSSLFVRVWTHGSLMYQNTHHHMLWVKVKLQFGIRDVRQDRPPEIQSSLVREDFQRIMGQVNELQISKSSFWQILHTRNVCLLEEKIQDWGMYSFTMSYGSYATDQRNRVSWLSGMIWNLSCSVKGFQIPNFEVLDTKIAAVLNRIIHNYQFKRRDSLEEQKVQKEVRFLRGRQITYLIYEYFRVIGVTDSVVNYADLFTITLRNDDIQEFDSKWDGTLLSMTKILLMTSWKDCTN